MVQKRKAEELLNNMIPDQSGFNQNVTHADTTPSVEASHEASKKRGRRVLAMPKPSSFIIAMLEANQIRLPADRCPKQKESHRRATRARAQVQAQGQLAINPINPINLFS